MNNKLYEQLDKLKDDNKVLRDALKKCRIELSYCYDQLKSRGASGGSSVVEALTEAKKALKQTEG